MYKPRIQTAVIAGPLLSRQLITRLLADRLLCSSLTKECDRFTGLARLPKPSFLCR